jgi:hypothetical protein
MYLYKAIDKSPIIYIWTIYVIIFYAYVFLFKLKILIQ